MAAVTSKIDSLYFMLYHRIMVRKAYKPIFIHFILAAAFVWFQTACTNSVPEFPEGTPSVPKPPEEPPFDKNGQKYTVMDFFSTISGKYTLLCIHNQEPNSQPSKQTDEMTKRTGRHPGMWSGDFLYQENDVNNRWTMIQECKRQWENGAIVHLMLHVVSPKSGSEAGYWDKNPNAVCSSLSNTEWTDLITDGGTLNAKWKARLDTYSEYFQYLKDNHVTVLFRPFHEMNQGVFWWAGRPGANGTAALFRLTRDYMENVKGLDNIIWVWNMQDLDYYWSQYNPGNDYWDVFSVDFYSGDGFTSYKYQTALNVAGNKPIAIGECFKMPTPQVLLSQPKWVFAMSWAGDTFKHNTDADLRTLYGAANTLVRDELPVFLYTGSGSAPAPNLVKNGNFSLCESVWPNLPLYWDITSTGGDGHSPVKTENGRFVGWANNVYSFTLSQDITGLDAGTYTLSADFRLNPDSVIDDITMSVYSGASLIKSKSVCADLLAAPRETDTKYELSGIEITGPEAKIEFAGTDILKFIGIDNVIFK